MQPNYSRSSRFLAICSVGKTAIIEVDFGNNRKFLNTDRHQRYYFNTGGKCVKSVYKKLFIAFMSALFLTSILTVVVLPVLGVEELVWEGSVPSDGSSVTSPILYSGVTYRIVSELQWWYDYPQNLASDSQYYTTDFSNSWVWGNYFPAPGGHSFMQINNLDVDWGPFSNGKGDGTGHYYEIYYEGEEAPITFRLVDWMDGNYANNVCHLRIRIYRETTVGGFIVDSNLWELAPFLGALALAIIITIPTIRYLRKSRF
jgi:hypothetical protein